MSPLLRLCTCGAVVARPPCATCRARQNAERNARPKAKRLWNTTAHRRNRARVLARDGECIDCGHTGTRDNPLTLDHTDYDDPHNPASGVTRCRRCHGRRHGGAH